MANPNIVNVTSIYGNTAYIIPAVTTAVATWTYNGSTALTGLTPAVGSVHKIDNIVVANVTASPVSISVAISNNAIYASGTANYISYQVFVPANATLIITDKTTAFYVTENQSVGVISSTASALHIVASFEVIS
jgi:hypothetical protein